MTDTIEITLPEKFTYDDYAWFFEASHRAMKQTDRVELNCCRVSYLDSAALGMIAYLHKQLKARGSKELIITQPTGYCEEIFQIANMYTHYVEKESPSVH